MEESKKDPSFKIDLDKVTFDFRGRVIIADKELLEEITKNTGRSPIKVDYKTYLDGTCPEGDGACPTGDNCPDVDIFCPDKEGPDNRALIYPISEEELLISQSDFSAALVKAKYTTKSHLNLILRKVK